MKTFGLASAILVGSAHLATLVAAIPPIHIKGSHFFFENGTEFFIRGVAYQQDAGTPGTTLVNPTATYIDPLADPQGCARDIPLLQELNTNVVRVYQINASLDHSQCMSMLASAGIYVIQDLSNPSNSINRANPSWTLDLFSGYAAVIDAMQGYNNTLGFFAGNEVSNNSTNTEASAFVKAAVRDSKAYIKGKGYRNIGVGYATNDDSDIRANLADYFNCGDQTSAIDFWGYNIYSWCGNSNYIMSGYDQRVAEFSNYSIPVFFAEYGCITPPRLFSEVDSIFSSNMTGVMSGGIVYMYFEEVNNYGLVTLVNPTSVSKLPSFTSYSAHINLVNPTNTAESAYQVTNTAAQACPTVGSTWGASNNLPPSANSDVCSCMVSSLSCVAKSGLTANQTSNLFSFVCASDPSLCVGITGNATNARTGSYGAYSMCYASQKLSYVLNAYYAKTSSTGGTCDFQGQAQSQTGSQSSQCQALLGQAGPSATGVVTAVLTSAPSPTSGSPAQSSTKGAASNVMVPTLNFGMLQLGAYVVTALLAGFGMVLL